MIHTRRAPSAGWSAVLALIALLFALPAFAAPTFPDLAGRRVADDAHVLSAATVTDLTAKLAALEAKTGHQLVVVTVPDLQGYDIEDYGYQLGRAWGIGQKGQNDGVLFIVAPTEHKVRIEVGYGLEPEITDALSSQILQTDVLPKLKTGDVDGGVSAGANDLINQLSLDPATAQAKATAAAAQQTQPHGGGIPGILVLIVLFLVFSSLFRRHGGGGMGWLLPMMILSSGSRNSWGGGSGGGFGGGGGFSGGGGSFGGGGASGSW
jgi:uncharacterized protein